MFKKKTRKILEQKIDWLIQLLEEGNIKELLYILGNKKEIIIQGVLLELVTLRLSIIDG